MYEGKRSGITNFTCYYWAYALALWQCVSFYQPIGGWFWNWPSNFFRIWTVAEITWEKYGLCDSTYLTYLAWRLVPTLRMSVLEPTAKPSHVEARAMYSTWKPKEGCYETRRGFFLRNHCFYVIHILIRC